MTGDKRIQNSTWQGWVAILLLILALIAVPVVALGGTDLPLNTTEPTVGVPDEISPGAGMESNSTPEPTPTEAVEEEVALTPTPTVEVPDEIPPGAGTESNSTPEPTPTEVVEEEVTPAATPTETVEDEVMLATPRQLPQYAVMGQPLPELPTADFTVNVTGGVAPLAVGFTDASTGTITSWTWDFENDGTIDSTEPNPTYIYTTAGTYTVNLTATNDAGSNSTVKTDYITIIEQALTSVTVSPDTAEVAQWEAMQFSTTALDQKGQLMEDIIFNWTSSNETVGTVDETGYFMALAPGTTEVTATNDTVSGTAIVTVTKPDLQVVPLPQNRHIFIKVANDDGVKYNLDGGAFGGWNNNTYYIKADGGGLNELHITADPAAPFGQVTTSGNQSGTFYVSNTGGRGYYNTAILLLAVNGTIPDDFAVHVRSSGYDDVPTTNTYVEGALDETFTKEDFIYGPQTWKPGPGTLGPVGMPLYEGHDVNDADNTFHLMFIDLNTGNLKTANYPGLTDDGLGAIKVEYSFENLKTFAAFNAYGWSLSANQGGGISWTNRLTPAGGTAQPSQNPSGYAVIGIPPALTSVTVSPDTAEVAQWEAMQFSTTALDQKGQLMEDIIFNWTSSNETVGTVDETGYFMALAPGTTEVTATNDTVSGTAIVTVTKPDLQVVPLPQNRHIFIKVANDDGVKYNLDGGTFGGWNNNTYYIKADGGGLNELHITADPTAPFGQVTTSGNQSGTFYVSNTGGRGYYNTVILLLAVNGTIPDDFAVHIRSSGYDDAPTNSTYVQGALDETFTKEDFVYGPQTWKPGPGTLGPVGMPLYEGHDVNDADNTFHLMFIDLNTGNVKTNPDPADEGLGATRIEYSFENLETFAAFNAYGWSLSANQGGGISWTNRLTPAGGTAQPSQNPSGYAIIGIPPFVSTITIDPETATTVVSETLQFTPTAFDQKGREMEDIVFDWTSSNETVGTMSTAGLFTARAPGTTTVTAAYGDVAGTAVVTVTPPQGDRTQDTPLDIPGCNVTTGNDGKPQVSVNTTAANTTVSGNTIRITEGNFILTIETEGAPTNESGTVNGTVANIRLDTNPIVTDLGAVGTVNVSVSLNLTGLPTGASLTTTVSQNVSADAQSAFQLAASADGLALGDVAYTMNVVRINLENGQDIAGATIRMAVSPAWVAAHGGADAIRIIRSAEDGTKEVLATKRVDNDADGNMVFEAYSPNGLSIFGLAAATAASSPSSAPSSSGGNSGTSTAVGAASNLKPGESATLAMDATAISAVTLTTKTDVKDAMVTVAKGSLPQAAEPPAGTLYQYVQATLYRASEADLAAVQFRLAIPNRWLAEQGSTAEQVTLFHYADGWQEVPVEALGEENGNAVFSAAANGFGLFAIVVTKEVPGATGDVTPEPTSPVTPTGTKETVASAEGTPATPQATPFPVWAAILAFGILFLVRRT